VERIEKKYGYHQGQGSAFLVSPDPGQCLICQLQIKESNDQKFVFTFLKKRTQSFCMTVVNFNYICLDVFEKNDIEVFFFNTAKALRPGSGSAFIFKTRVPNPHEMDADPKPVTNNKKWSLQFWLMLDPQQLKVVPHPW
jgi:hypothetical protein